MKPKSTPSAVTVTLSMPNGISCNISIPAPEAKRIVVDAGLRQILPSPLVDAVLLISDLEAE